MSETPEADWYLLLDGESQGPYGADDLRAWVAEGRIPADTLCWNEHMAEWAPVAIALGLADTSPPPPPVESPPPAPPPLPTPPAGARKHSTRKPPKRGAFLGVLGILVLVAILAGTHALYRLAFPGYPPEVAKAYALYEAGQFGRAFMDLYAYSSTATEALRKDHASFMSNSRDFPLPEEGSGHARELPEELQRAFQEILHPEAGMLVGQIVLVHTPEVVYQLAREESSFPDPARQFSKRGARALLYAVLVDSSNLRRAQDIIGQAYDRVRFRTPEEAAAYFLPYCLAMLDAGDLSECAEDLESIPLSAEVMAAVVKPLFCRPAGALGGEGPALELERQYDEFARQTFTNPFRTRFAEELGRAVAVGITRLLTHCAETGEAPDKFRERPDRMIDGMAELLEHIETVSGPGDTAGATQALAAAVKTFARAGMYEGTYLHWDSVIRHAHSHPELQAALLDVAERNASLASALGRQAMHFDRANQARVRQTFETNGTEPSDRHPGSGAPAQDNTGTPREPFGGVLPSPPPAPARAIAPDIEPMPRPQPAETPSPSELAPQPTEDTISSPETITTPVSDEQDAVEASNHLARLEAEVVALLTVPSVEASDYQFGRAQQDCRKALRTIDQEPGLAHLRPAAQELLAWLELAVSPEQRFVLEGHMAASEQTLLHIRDLLDQERISVRVGRLIRGYEVLEFDASAGRVTLKRGTRTHYIYSR